MTNTDPRLSASELADALEQDKRRERADEEAKLQHEQEVLDRLTEKWPVN
jgi:hypothetical protein